MRRLSDILQERATLLLIAIGLSLIAIGNSIDLRILKIELGNLTAEVGGLLLIIGLIHWLYESSMRRQLFQELLEAVVGAGRLSASGIIDFNIHSHDIDYHDAIQSSKMLMIGEHYSPRVFESFAPAFRNRNAAGLETTILLLARGCPAEIYLSTSLPAYGNPQPKIARISEIIQAGAPATGPAPVTIRWHRQILKYSFLRADEYIWIRFYRNTTGFSHVPAFCVKKGSELYDFFATDIDALLKESSQ